MDPYLSNLYHQVWKDIHGFDLPLTEAIPMVLENAVHVAVSNFILSPKRNVSYSDGDSYVGANADSCTSNFKEDIGLFDVSDDEMSMNEDYDLPIFDHSIPQRQVPIVDHEENDQESLSDSLENLCSEEEVPRNYMEFQQELTPAMRAILINWLVKVHDTRELRFDPEALHICVSIIDRYLASTQVTRQDLQLVGVAALCIADKYGEGNQTNPPGIVNLMDGMVTPQEVVDMEETIMAALNYKVKVPTAFHFLELFVDMIVMDTSNPVCVGLAALYYLERTMQEYDFVHYRPSLVALSALTLAMNNTSIVSVPFGLPLDLLDFIGSSRIELMECADSICVAVKDDASYNGRELVAVKRKYAVRDYNQISTQFENPDLNDLLRWGFRMICNHAILCVS